MSSKELQDVVECVVDALPPRDPKVICEALGRVAAVFLAEYDEMKFEIWIKSVRDTRNHVRGQGKVSDDSL